MKLNLYDFYADPEMQQRTAGSLVIFGATIFKSSKIVQAIDYLDYRLNNLSTEPPISDRIIELIRESLIDSIKILIFFENYMKAKLIVGDYCIHEIDSNIDGFKLLASEQKKRPLKSLEIHEVENFQINSVDKTITHRAIKETTIKMSTLIYKAAYIEFLGFERDVLEEIRELNRVRNQLHFNLDAELSISKKRIESLKKMDRFVDASVKPFLPPEEVAFTP